MTPCPYCGRLPEVDLCEPWPRNHGPAPWYAACYKAGEREHCVAVGGDTKAGAIAQWETTAAALASMVAAEKS